LKNETNSEGQAVRAAACCCFLATCLGLASCSLFGKKAASKPNEPPGSSRVGLPSSSDTSTTASSDPPLPPRVNGVLAGRVLDSYDRRPPPTFIQVVSAQGAKGTPAEVAADSQGYFTIQGLQPGQHYQLIARTRDGDSKLAGTTWAIPPNPRVLIFMSSDFATPNTPAAPSPPTIPGQKSGPQSTQLSPPSAADQTTTSPGNVGADVNRDPAKPSSIGPSPRAVEIGAPTPGPAAPAQMVPSQPRIEDIVRPDGQASLPVANIPPQGNAGRRPPSDPSSPYPPEATARITLPPSVPPTAIPLVATPVPSCVLTGRQLENFALNDLNAKPWEYRQHAGKVVLLDFWGTWCLPCRQAIPHLNILQSNYGRYGLEVIGIAYEDGPLQEQVRKVRGVSDRMGINYRLLLGAGTSCPVRTQFAVQHYPTLVLLNQDNRIIWRQEGLDAYKLQELETLIQQQLKVR
jgi:thiol-disulfide isomerase/thioredoxin